MCKLGNTQQTQTLEGSKPLAPHFYPEAQALAQQTLKGVSGALPGSVADANSAATSLRTAAGDPAFGAIQNYGNSLLRGDYLNGSPALTAQLSSLDATGARNAANFGARVRSSYATNGMPMSTASLQALQAGNAAQGAATNATKANTIFQNYQQERGYQNEAPNLLYTNMSMPGQFLQSAAAAPLMPYAQASGILAQTDKGPVQQPLDNVMTNKPGVLNYLQQGAGILSTLAGGAAGIMQYNR